MDWHRRRHPDDVPTPVAVAVSDFCRRAKAHAPPALVRDALALLSDDDDFRVQAMADSEPTSKLGPFAVVDVILGTEEAVAAQREETGYYEMVRKMAEENASSAPPPAPPMPKPVRHPTPSPQGALASAPRVVSVRASPPPAPKKSKKKLTVAEKIAPRKRDPNEKLAERPAPPLPGTAFLPKRNLPLPRGRFTTIDPTRASVETLFRGGGKATLQTLIDQVPNRVALLRALEQGYVGKRGKPLAIGDVEDLLEEHELFEQIEVKEKEGVLAALVENKGSLGKSAHAVGMNRDDLELLIGALGLEREVEEIRERFIKEAMAEANLALRLDLLFRNRY
ncbi:MAG: hypothetical protein JNM17_32105, partial [Archangium sp.]|nr:hypothetical protein [Archangium sp.]